MSTSGIQNVFHDIKSDLGAIFQLLQMMEQDTQDPMNKKLLQMAIERKARLHQHIEEIKLEILGRKNG